MAESQNTRRERRAPMVVWRAVLVFCAGCVRYGVRRSVKIQNTKYMCCVDRWALFLSLFVHTPYMYLTEYVRYTIPRHSTHPRRNQCDERPKTPLSDSSISLGGVCGWIQTTAERRPRDGNGKLENSRMWRTGRASYAIGLLRNYCVHIQGTAL